MYHTSETKLLSTKEAAKRLGYTHDYISKLCREGLLKGEQIGRSWFVEEAALEIFAEEHKARLETFRENASERMSVSPSVTATPPSSPPTPSPFTVAVSRVGLALCATLIAFGGTTLGDYLDTDGAIRAALVREAREQVAAVSSSESTVVSMIETTVTSWFLGIGNTVASWFSVPTAHAPEYPVPFSPVVDETLREEAVTTFRETQPSQGSTTYVTHIHNTYPFTIVSGGVSLEYVRTALDNLRDDLADRESGGGGGGIADISGESLEDLADVATMTKNLGDLLYWDGTAWADIATSSLGISGSSFGTDNQIPFTNAGGTNFDYSNNLTFDGTTLSVTGGVVQSVSGVFRGDDEYHQIIFHNVGNRTDYFEWGDTLAAGGGHRFFTGGPGFTLRAQIADDGAYFQNRVGIGTTSPYAALSVVGETVASHFTATTSATSTFPNVSISGALSLFGTYGTVLSDFCEAITGGAGLCDGTDNTGGGAGLSTSTPIADTYVLYGTSASDVGAEAAFTYDDATNRLTVPFASTTGISSSYASSTSAFFGNLSVGVLTGVLKASGGVVSTGLVNLASEVTGVLGITNGGTGTSTPGLLGQLLSWNGTNWQGVATSTLGIAISDTSGTLQVDRGGTGATSFADNRILTGNGTSALVDEAALTFDGSLLTVTGNASTTQLSVAQKIYIGDSGSDTPLSGAQIVSPGGWWGIRQDMLSRFNVDTWHNGTNMAVFSIDQLGNTSIGTTTSLAQLTVWADTQTTTLLNLVDMSSTTVLTVKTNGNVGIGTTTPYARLSVVGQAIAEYFSATSTSATSTFPELQASHFTLGVLTGVLKASGGAVTTGLVNLATEVTGTLGISNGGTGTSTPAALGQVLSWNGTSWQGVATSTLGFSSSFTTTYPLQFAADVLSLAFGTTTSNTWGGTQTFTNPIVVSSGTSTFTGNIEMSGDIIPGADDTYSLGRLDRVWRDVFIGPGSLYINGKKVLQDISDTITFSTDADQNLVTETSGIGSATLRAIGSGNVVVTTDNGNINITSTSGNLNLGTTGSGQLNLGTVTSGVWHGTDIDISDYTNLSVSYPLVLSGDTISLAFGTTTQNSWNAHNIFSSLFATNASSTNATTTTFGIGSETFTDLTGTGLQNVGGALTLNATGDWTGTFDGIDGGGFLRSDTSDSYTSGTLTFDAGTALDLNTTTLTIADTDIAFDGASVNFNTTGDFSINTDDLYVVKSSGNVGIGTTTPDATLEVYGNFRVDGDNAGGVAKNNGQLIVRGATDFNKQLQIAFNTTDNYAWLQSAVWGSSFTNLALNPHGGNVGIGTASPAEKFEVRSAIASTSASNNLVTSIKTSDAVTPFALITGFTGGASVSVQDWWLQTQMYGVSNVGNLSLQPFGGNVGIGTTSPFAQFSVQGSGGGNVIAGGWAPAGAYGFISLNGQNSTGSNFYSSPSDPNLYINRPTGATMNFRMNNADQVIINSAGNVGIGSTTPNSKLVLSGNTDAFSKLRTENTGSGYSLDVGGRNATSDFPYLQSFTTSNNVGTSLLINPGGGNVGVGITDPSTTRLHVQNATDAPVAYFHNNLGSGFMSSNQAVLRTNATNPTSNPSVSFAIISQYNGSGIFGVRHDGNVIIGPGSPAAYAGYTTLTLNNATNGGIIDFNVNGVRKGEIFSNSTQFGLFGESGVSLLFYAGGAHYASLDTAGNFVMTQTNSSGGNTNLCWDGSGGSVWGSCTSLAAYKENIENLGLGLETVRALRPVTFDWKSSGTHDLGFIAEEVEDIAPLLAEYAGPEGALSGVKYNTMSVLAIRAIQELDLNIQTIIDGAASTTPASQTFADAFFARLRAWFADAANGIGTLVANVFTARERLCVDDQCLTRDDVRALLQLVGEENVPDGNGGGGGEPPAEELPPSEGEGVPEEDEEDSVEEGEEEGSGESAPEEAGEESGQASGASEGGESEGGASGGGDAGGSEGGESSSGEGGV